MSNRNSTFAFETLPNNEMRTFILAWNPAISDLSDEWFNSAMRELEWGDITYLSPEEPAADSGDNFYIVRTDSSSRQGIVAKGFFLSPAPHLKRKGESYYEVYIRPTFMVQWYHPKGILELDRILDAIPEFPDPRKRWCQELPPVGIQKMDTLWSYYTSRFEKDDFNGELLERSERPVAGIDEAVSIASEALFDVPDVDDRPLILNALGTGMAGKTDDEKICGFLHLVMNSAPWTPGRFRESGFQEHIVDALNLLYLTGEPLQVYLKHVVESGNDLAINVTINYIQYCMDYNGDAYDYSVYKEYADAIDYLKKATRKEVIS